MLKIERKKLIKAGLSGLAIIGLITAGWWWFSKDTQEVKAGWWNESWSYRKAIVINSAKVTADLENFPMLVSLTDANLGTKAQASGNDIVFIDREGKKLAHEIEGFATSTGVLVAWVKIPALSSTQDETIYMYYGNAAAPDQQDVHNVWDENYYFVHHFEEIGTGDRTDSTANSKNGVANGFEGDEATSTGKIGWANDFDGTDDTIEISDATNWAETDFTVSLWINMDNARDYDRIVYIDDQFQIAYHDSQDYLAFKIEPDDIDGRVATTLILGNNEWKYLTFTWNHASKIGQFFINGSSVTTNTNNPSAYGWTGSGRTDNKLYLLSYGSAAYIDGQMDEARMSILIRSADWIATEYANQNDPASFLSIQEEETGPGPVGWWSFDEGYGDTAHDGSGQGNHGTIAGAAWQDESMCVSGKCLYFDGANDMITVPDNYSLDFTNAISISAWVKLTGNPSNDGTIVMKEDNTQTSNVFALFTQEVGVEPYFQINESGPGFETPLDANTWYHIAVSCGTNNNLEYYLNGAIVKTGDYCDTISTSNQELTIGGNNPWGDYFKGFIDEVKIYPYARTADQIRADYAAGLAGIGTSQGVSAAFGSKSDNWMSDGLVGYWKFDESATTSGAIDSSGNGNDGTYYGDASTTAGKYGNGGVFDGSGDYINAGDINSIDGVNKLTISAWMKRNSASNDVVIEKGPESNNKTGFKLYSGGVLYFNISNDNNYFAEISNNSTDWQHITMVFDGTKLGNSERLKCYLNGVVLNVNFTGTIPAFTDINSSPLNIGYSEILHN